MIAPVLDELDKRLIAVLAEDARVSNRRIASQIGVTEGTVRARLKRLQQEGLIAFTAVTSFDVSSTQQMGFIRAQVDSTRLVEVAQLATDIPKVDAVLMAIGTYNLILVCLTGDIAELHEIASHRIAMMDGVYNVITAISVKTMKYNHKIVKIYR